MAWRLAGFFWRMPKLHPTASTIITGIVGIAIIIQGIALAATVSYTGQSNVAGGIVVCLLGLAAVGLAAYAMIDTQRFQIWMRPDGSYGHALVRYAGPILLIVALIEVIVVLWILSIVLPELGKKY
jgi:hypothetical protein